MEEAFIDVPLYRTFARLDEHGSLPDESTILRFRHRLEEHSLAKQILCVVNEFLAQKGLMLKIGTIVDATLIAAPSSTKNKSKARDPEMHSSKKGNQWYFGMKAHIGVDLQSGLVHTVRCTSGNVNDVTQAQNMLHGKEKVAFGDAGYQGVEKREEADPKVTWLVAMKPGQRRTLRQEGELGEVCEKLEQAKARIRAKVEHPFRVLKRQFGYVKVRYRGLAKNAAQVATLFALSNLWMVRRKLP